MYQALPLLLASVVSLAQEPVGPFDAAALVGDAPYRDGHVIVRYDGSTGVDAALDALDSDRFHLVEPLFPTLDVYLYQVVDGTRVPDAIRDIRVIPGVRWAQADHLVDLRGTTPNDTSFGQQWCHQQAQDHDMDSTEAWDISRGSNEFVVAVVDGGGQHNHTDLSQNRWENPAEVGGVPGFDDDGNGYVDDFYGWNAYSNNGSIPASNHGTHVGGIVGARGNNGKGVAGVNWNVDLMWVAASSSSTAIATKGYSYVFTQKSLFLATGGAKGANVVATNSSFGIDFANCNAGSYPLWNDMYDQMGSVGILSCAATANMNINVDVSGDVPTGCGSNYLISVTNTTSGDVKSTGAAYGASSIDLGAPGTSIRSTLPTNTYGNLSGTSMATPQVAGAVALLHASASAQFKAFYAADPAAAALELKQMILGNVDQLASLQGKSVTGGRLNLAKSAQSAASFDGGSPPPPTCGFAAYGQSLGGANDATLQLSGAPSPGSSFSLQVSGFTGSGLARVVMSSVQANQPIVGGTLLVNFGSQVFSFDMPFSGGAGGATIIVPNSPALIGYTGYFQSAAPDSTQPQGWTLSNGVQMVVCP